MEHSKRKKRFSERTGMKAIEINKHTNTKTHTYGRETERRVWMSIGFGALIEFPSKNAKIIPPSKPVEKSYPKIRRVIHHDTNTFCYGDQHKPKCRKKKDAKERKSEKVDGGNNDLFPVEVCLMKERTNKRMKE